MVSVGGVCYGGIERRLAVRFSIQVKAHFAHLSCTFLFVNPRYERLHMFELPHSTRCLEWADRDGTCGCNVRPLVT